MGISFNPKEMLASIANSCMVAFCQAQGMMPNDAAVVGGVAEGAIKGFSIQKTDSSILGKLEYVIKQSIRETMQTNGFWHLPSDFENIIFESAFSVDSIKTYLTNDKPVEILAEAVKNGFALSEAYDTDTLPIEALAVGLIEKINASIQDDHELTVLSTIYKIDEIKNILQTLVPPVSKFEEAILNMKSISEYTPLNQLHFLNRKMGFWGRIDEIEWLDKFRDSPQNLLYAFVQGSSGVGKSRLMYEYIHQHSDDKDWHLCFLNNNLIASLMDFESYEYSKNLLVVIDYAGRYAATIGKWILRLAESRNITNKIRIVLIERQSKQISIDRGFSVSWIQDFYGNTSQKRILTELEYGCLTVLQLDKPDLFRIMDDYSTKVVNKGPLSSEEKEQIFEYVSTALRLEPFRQTPLFVLLATDAFLCEGSARNWDIDLLAEGYVDRMLEYWLEALCQKDKKLYDSLLRVLVFATAIGGIDLNGTIPNFIAGDLDRIIQAEDCRTIFENSSGLNNEIVLPIQPDYIGEFVFLRYLSKVFPNRNRHAFLGELYCNPMEFMCFFVRCIDDFAHSNMFKPIFDDITNLLEPTCGSVVNYVAFASIIADFAAVSTQVQARKCADALGIIFEDRAIQESQYSDIIGSLYSGILNRMTHFDGYDGSANIDFPRTTDWSLADARDSVKKLRNLYHNFFDKNPRVLLPFAQALANCSIYDTFVEARQCADELSELYEKHCATEPEIAISFAIVLNNVVCKIANAKDISLAGYAEEAVLTLSKLYDKHVSNLEDYSDIAVCMINAVSDAKLREAVNKQIKAFYAEMNRKQIGVAVEYAKALENITGLYASSFNDKAGEYFGTLEKLYDLHKADDTRITVEYAKGIVAFIVVCTEDKAEQMLCALRDLCNNYKEDKAMFSILMLRYAKALHNRLALAAKNGECDEGIDWVFNEMVTINNCFKHIYDELPVLYINSLYYMFCIKLCNNCIDDCLLLLNTLINIRDTADSNICNIIDKYIMEMDQLFS